MKLVSRSGGGNKKIEKLKKERDDLKE